MGVGGCTSRNYPGRLFPDPETWQRLFTNIFSAFAQFERRLIQERTKMGLAAARAQGRKGGRPPLNPNAPTVVLAQKLYRDKSNSVADICAMMKISRTTSYKYVSLGRKKGNHSAKTSV